MTTSDTVLEVDGLVVRYGGVAAVRGLSLTVAKGEIVGLIGPNGAGKSSTLHALMGLVPAAGGDVRLEGRSILGNAPETVARSGIALVPEGRRIFADLTVEENLRLGLAGRARRGGGAEDIAAVYDLFPIVREFRRRHAGALSGGQQQQLAIARALVADPAVLILDDATSAVDPSKEHEIRDAMSSVMRDRTTIVIAHRAGTIAMADRVVLVDQGRVVADGTHDELLATSSRYRAVLAASERSDDTAHEVTG